MAYVIVSTDDMYPSCVGPLWEKYWDVLKQRHPKLLVSVFAVPFFWGRKENDIVNNKVFFDWWKKRKSWVEICQHGFKHNHPAECQFFRRRQYVLLRQGLRKIRKYLPNKVMGFKPPFYRYTKQTFIVLKQLGFSYVVVWGKPVFLVEQKVGLPECVIIESHTNLDEQNVDGIEKIYEKLDLALTELENKGYEYSTYGRIIKKCI